MKGKYHKPADLKYTDLCIYIDNNMQYIVNNGEYPEIEMNIYEYLYHILYALACKQNFFNNFDDYDAFAMYGAGQLYISMRNRQINVNKVVRGKEVLPIKSCLNFIKSVLFPLKVNYQRENFASIFNPEVNQDTTKIERDLKEGVLASYRSPLFEDLQDVIRVLPKIFNKIIKQSPYRNDELMCQNIYLSCLLTMIDNLTLPQKLRKKANKYLQNIRDDKVYNFYRSNCDKVVLWHLPEHMSDYVKLLTREIKYELGKEIEETRSATDLSDEILDDILKSAYSNYSLDEGEF